MSSILTFVYLLIIVYYIAPEVKQAGSIDEINLCLKDHQVVFILNAGFNNEQSTVVSTFYEIAKSMHGHAFFVHLSIDNDNTDAVIEKAERGLNFKIAMTGEITKDSIVKFVQLHNRPYIATIDNNNFKTLGFTQKTLAIAAIDVNTPAGQEMLTKFKDIAVKSHADIENELILGIMDPIKYSGYLHMFRAKGPCVLIVNMISEEFYVVNNSELQTPGKLKTTLIAAAKNMLAMTHLDHHLQNLGTFRQIVNKFWDYYPWSAVLCVVTVVIALVSMSMSNPRNQKIKNS